MPARLPDEDLAPVEGTPPPQVGVAPTSLGLNVGADALSQATTVGYRAAAIQAKAQATQDAAANAPLVTGFKSVLDADLRKSTADYDGHLGFGAEKAAFGQSALADYKDRIGYDKLTPGRQVLFDRAAAEALNANQADALVVQNTHQATMVGNAYKGQQEAKLGAITAPFMSDAGKLEAHVALTEATNPNAQADYASSARALAQASWEANSAGLSAQEQATLKPQYDLAVENSIIQSQSRIADAHATYATSHLLNTVSNTLDTSINSIRDNPETYQAWKAPGGARDQALAALGTGKLYDDAKAEGDSRAASAYIEGLGDKNPALALSELHSGNYDAALGVEAKTGLENKYAAYSPSAIAKGTEAQQIEEAANQSLVSVATEGVTTLTAQQQADMVAVKGGEWVGAYQAKLADAQAIFKAHDSVPLSKMAQDDVDAIVDRGEPSVTDPQFGIKEGLYKAAKAEVDGRYGDSATWTQGLGATGPGGGPSKTNAELQGVLDGGAGQVKAGAVYSQDQLQTLQNAKLPQGSWRLLPVPKAKELADDLMNAPSDAKYGIAKNLQAMVQAFPEEVQLAHGLSVSPRRMVVQELQKAGLTADYIAVMVDTPGGAGANSLLGQLIASKAIPELQKPLDGRDAKALKGAVLAQMGQYTDSMKSPGDLDLNPGRIDAVTSIARYLRNQRPGLSWNDAAQQAAAPLTGAYAYGPGFRMPIAEASKSVVGAPRFARPGEVEGGQGRFGFMGVGQPYQRLDAAQQGMAHVTSFFTGDGGVNLQLPNYGNGMTMPQNLKMYADQISQSAHWTNVGDGQVALVTPSPDGQWHQVYDRYKRPIVMGWDEAANVGLGKKSSFETPGATVATPAGNPVHATHPAVAAAAISGAIVAHAQGAAAAAGVKTNAPAPPAPANDQAPPPAAAAPLAALPPAALNEKQLMLQRANAPPDVIAMFGDGPPVAATSQAAPAMAGGNPPLNVTMGQAVKILQPLVIQREHGAGGATSPKGNVGLMQIGPATLHDMAIRLHLPVESMEYARTHDDYNLAIGTEYLNYLSHQYNQGGNSMAGMALTLAAFNAGPGAVDKWLATIGDPRGGRINLNDFVARIPYKETREYVQHILPRAAARLGAVMGTGPAA